MLSYILLSTPSRHTTVPEFVDTVFAKTNLTMTENERFGLVCEKNRSINSGTGLPNVNST
jgi:hypothetical protein